MNIARNYKHTNNKSILHVVKLHLNKFQLTFGVI